jgi:hypothetical protein
VGRKDELLTGFIHHSLLPTPDSPTPLIDDLQKSFLCHHSVSSKEHSIIYETNIKQ